MHEQPRTLEVREELVPEPDALARALDQAGHVGDGQLAAVGPVDRAEHGRERRERVVGHLWLRVRDAAQQRRLAGVRQPGQRRVGDQLELQLELARLTGEPRLGEPRRLSRRRGEARVPAAAAAAARGDDRARAGMGEVGDEAAVLEDLRPDRHAQLDVVPSAPCLRVPRPLPPRSRPDTRSCREATTGRASLASATSTTSPPRPPSPPSGPPFGTYFSRRKLSPPSPPRPAAT